MPKCIVFGCADTGPHYHKTNLGFQQFNMLPDPEEIVRIRCLRSHDWVTEPMTRRRAQDWIKAEREVNGYTRYPEPLIIVTLSYG